jgi:hypothetical protein
MILVSEKRDKTVKLIEKITTHNNIVQCNYCLGYMLPGERYILEYTNSHYEGKKFIARACQNCKEI